jgi:hypothetical protein
MHRAPLFVQVCGTLCSIFAAAASAQPAIAPAATPASASGPAAQICKPIPYQVGVAVKGAEVAANFSAAAIKKLASLPDFSARAGVEVVKPAYAGMVAQAMSDVFDALGCRVTTFIKDTDVDAEKKREAVRLGIARLNGELSIVQAAYGGGLPGVMMLVDRNVAAARADGAPVLDPAIISAALRSIDTDALFIKEVTTTFWGSLDYGKYASVSACGGLVKAAISDGGSAMQKALASTRDILVNYLDPNTALVVSLGKLMVAGAPITANPLPAATFKGCTQALNQLTAAEAEKAASAPTASASAPANPASAP